MEACFCFDRQFHLVEKQLQKCLSSKNMSRHYESHRSRRGNSRERPPFYYNRHRDEEGERNVIRENRSCRKFLFDGSEHLALEIEERFLSPFFILLQIP